MSRLAVAGTAHGWRNPVATKCWVHGHPIYLGACRLERLSISCAPTCQRWRGGGGLSCVCVCVSAHVCMSAQGGTCRSACIGRHLSLSVHRVACVCVVLCCVVLCCCCMLFMMLCCIVCVRAPARVHIRHMYAKCIYSQHSNIPGHYMHPLGSSCRAHLPLCFFSHEYGSRYHRFFHQNSFWAQTKAIFDLPCHGCCSNVGN